MICSANSCMMQSKKPLQSCRTIKPLLSGGGITNGRPGPKLKRIPVLNRFHEEVITYHSYTGTGFTAAKPNGKQWDCGFANEHFYAGFPHLYWAGTALPRRFVDAAAHYHQEEQDQ